MRENEETGQITEEIHHVHAVVFLTPLPPELFHEIQLRIQERTLQPIAIIEGTLYTFRTHEAFRLWKDAVDGLLSAARIRYITARLVDPVFGVVSQEEGQRLVDLGLDSYCDILSVVEP